MATFREQTEFRSFEPPRRVLLGPGPSDVPRRVLDAMARPTIGHLDPEFIGFMDQMKSLLRYAFRTKNQLTMPISGPGTAGMECCVNNLVEPGDKVVVCINGVFGGRLKEMALRSGAEVIVVQDDWGRAVTPEKLEDALRQNSGVKVVAFVHAETSTGAKSDVQTLVSIARQYDCLTIVDTVTSLGGVPLEIDGWGVDAAYSGSQKCLSSSPGLSPITLSDRALAAIKARRKPVQSWFLDLSLVLTYWEGTKRAYHHTAPINPLYGLHESLVILSEEGIENSWARHQRNHETLVAGLEVLGLAILPPQGERLPDLNAVIVPEGVDEARVRARLLDEFSIEVGAGLGPLAGKVWRIGLMGYSSRPENITKFLDALETILASEGATLPKPEAVRT